MNATLGTTIGTFLKACPGNSLVDYVSTSLVDKTNFSSDWSFDVVTGQYRDNSTGMLLSDAKVRAAIEGVIDGAKKEAGYLTSDMQSGKKSVNDWKAGMLALIVSLHTLASSVVIGGIPGMLGVAEADLRTALAQERIYLDRYGKQITMLLLSLGMKAVDDMTPPPVQRARSYMDAALITYERQRYLLHQFLEYKSARRVVNAAAEHCDGCETLAALGWVPIEQLIPLGHEQCGQWCACRVEYSKLLVGGH